MNAIVPFNFGDQPMRIQDRDGEPWFVLADVCRVLEISNVSDASARLEEDEKDDIALTDAIGRQQQVLAVNEAGFYRLVLRSRKEAAKRLSRWVAHDVLPSIRRTGGYGSASMALPRDPRELLAYIAQQAEDMVALHDATASLASKAHAFDRLTNTRGALGIREAAKALKIGQQQLVDWMMQNGWAYRSTANSRLVGYRPREIAGMVEHKPSRIPTHDGPDKIVSTLQITAKGLAKIAEALGPRP